jgi:uncharacterized membrane protein YphA (DoxX/SURF4 family)
MDIAIMIIQIIIALGIFNVWLLRYNKATSYRGGGASNMKEEFRVYGLPAWSVNVVGFLKLVLAVLLLIGIWFPVVVLPAAAGMAILMIGALAMHFKVKDPLMRSLPAFSMLVMSLAVAYYHF